jgi:predicted glycoside hydrolase/deacetylase ChbG (UPF0249 family)
MATTFVVINADDFGISSGANREIVRCVESGAITSTTIMANEAAFAEAVELARDHGFSNRIGVHLNLCHGRPLSDLPARLRREDGTLAFPQRRTWASSHDLDSLQRELEAQVQRVVDSGIQPSHFDSHEHWINSFPYTRVVLHVARRFGVRWIRPARNWLYRPSLVKSGFKLLYNGYLRRHDAMGVRYFTDCKDFLEFRRQGGSLPAGGLELMCHPAATLTGGSVPNLRESDLLESQPFRDSLAGATLLSYRELPAC